MALTRDRDRRRHAAAELEGGPRHLKHLYRITKLLSSFASVEKTLPRVLALLSRTLLLRSAVVIVERAGEARTFTWHVPGVTPARLAEATTHARSSFAYLAGYDAVRIGELEGSATTASLLPERRLRAPEAGAPATLVVLPLVSGAGGVFGALQIEASSKLDEVDLAYVNATANQLGTALLRHDHLATEIRLRERAQVLEHVERELHAREKAVRGQAERSARRLELLAEVSGRITASLDSPATLAEVALLGIPLLADWCLVDLIALDGSVRRVAVTDPAGARWGRMLERVSQAAALRAGGPEIVREMTPAFLETLARGPDELEAVRALGADSCLIVPLTSGEAPLGVITFIRAQPGRFDEEQDLLLAVELCRRAILAIENARLYEKARAAIRSRDDFLAIVSHDLRSPLGAVMLTASLLARGAPRGKTGDLSRTRAESIRSMAHRMDRLIGDLLDVTSMETGKLSNETRTLDAGAIVAEALAMMQPLASARERRLERGPGHPALRVVADRERLLQVFSNLIGNAIKFIPEGGTITVDVKERGTAALFSVKDSGPGIPKEQLGHVFDRYWQASRSRAGVGLGLAITKMIVESHGGEIWVESEPGRGCVFSFTVPRA